jgi:hypothetical protein
VFSYPVTKHERNTNTIIGIYLSRAFIHIFASGGASQDLKAMGARLGSREISMDSGGAVV